MPRVTRWSTDRAVEANDDQLVTGLVRGGEGQSCSFAAAGGVEASRGFGAEIAREALSRGHQVVATARSKDAVEAALSDASSSLLAVSLDVTDEAQVAVAVKAAVKCFGACPRR